MDRRQFLKVGAAVPVVAVIPAEIAERAVKDPLDAPEPPAGYEHRWIRMRLAGGIDVTRLTEATTAGWQPAIIDNELLIHGDLMLCRRARMVG